MHHSSVIWDMTLLYFCSWNCTWFGLKEPIKAQDFRLSTAHGHFDRLLKVFEILVKQCRGVMSHDPEAWCKIWSVLSKMTRIWWNLTRVLENLQNLHFHLLLLCKVFNVWPKKVQRSYLSWYWRVTQNLKKNWLVVLQKWQEYGRFSPKHLKVSKLGLWWDTSIQSRKKMSLKFTEKLSVMTMKNDAKFEEKLACHFKIEMRNLMNFSTSTLTEIFLLMCSFWAKYTLFELKKYIGVIFHDTEEGYKIWRGIELLFQNWHKKFDKFWSEHSKVSKMFTLMGSFWPKYILFELKKYRGVIFHDTEEGYKIWREIDFLF